MEKGIIDIRDAMERAKAAAHSDYLHSGQTLAGQGGIIGGYSSSQIIIPMPAYEWKKLTRATQLTILDELGMLNKEGK